MPEISRFCGIVIRMFVEPGAAMSHAIYRVEGLDIVGPHVLDVRFNDGTAQRIDFRPVLEGELFGPIRDLTVFNALNCRVSVDYLDA